MIISQGSVSGCVALFIRRISVCLLWMSGSLPVKREWVNEIPPQLSGRSISGKFIHLKFVEGGFGRGGGNEDSFLRSAFRSYYTELLTRASSVFTIYRNHHRSLRFERRDILKHAPAGSGPVPTAVQFPSSSSSRLSDPARVILGTWGGPVALSSVRLPFSETEGSPRTRRLVPHHVHHGYGEVR